MEWEFKNGKMELIMRASGKIMQLMERVNLRMLMEMNILVIGLMANVMDKESILVWMDPAMMGNGKMIGRTALGRKHGQMVLHLLELTRKA